MAHIQPGLSMCHLQAYPSRMLILFSQRKDDVPKICFPDNNIGQESSIALPSPLCQETRPTVLNGSFSIFKQTKSYLHILALFSPPSDATKLSLLQVDQELPDPLPQASVSSEGHGTPIFMSWIHYPYRHSSKETVEN